MSRLEVHQSAQPKIHVLTTQAQTPAMLGRSSPGLRQHHKHETLKTMPSRWSRYQEHRHAHLRKIWFSSKETRQGREASSTAPQGRVMTPKGVAAAGLMNHQTRLSPEAPATLHWSLSAGSSETTALAVAAWGLHPTAPAPLRRATSTQYAAPCRHP